MATSYTSLLGLALPVTGELSGTWGDTVNNSITSLLDTAVAGTTTLSTDGDVTLSTTTGASNQARQAILLCSGARTALRTIEKHWTKAPHPQLAEMYGAGEKTPIDAFKKLERLCRDAADDPITHGVLAEAALRSEEHTSELQSH